MTTTTDPIRAVLARLGVSVKSAGAGKWAARCPAHEDRTASLSITTGDDGRVLLRCHAGCPFNSIMAAIGMKPGEAFPSKDHNGRHSNGHRSDLGPIIATYNYVDAEGNLCHQTTRHSPKAFRQRRPDGNGGWVWSLKGIEPILYRLPELLAAAEDRPDDFVCIGEGERDVDTIRAAGCVATCNPMGAGKWQDRYSETLRGRRCCIIADKDAPGRAHAQQVAASLASHGAADVRIVECPGDGVKDASDYLAAGGTAETLLALIEAAPAWTPTPDPSNPPDIDPPSDPPSDAPRFIFLAADKFDALDLRKEYHIPGILAAGPIPTILAGSFKTLKTSIMMDLGISVATGSAFLRHFNVTKPCPVGIMSGESGGYALQYLARRVAHSKGWTMGAIGSQLQICTAIPNSGNRSDMADVRRFVEEQNIGLLFLDPAYLMMRGMRSDDAGNLFAMAQFLDPVGKLADATGCTVGIIHHNSRGATRANVGEPAELSDIAWSGFPEWAGQWLLLSRRERFDPDSNGEHKLWLSAGGRDGHSNLVGVNIVEGRSDDPGGMGWDVTVERASGVRREAATMVQEQREQDRRTRLEKQGEQDSGTIMAVMLKLKAPETQTGIRDRAGLRGQRFNPVFAALLAEGKIVPKEAKKGNGRAYEGYLAASHPDATVRNGTHPDCPAVASERDAPL